MSSLTQEELQEIASFNAAAHSKFTGLLMDDGPGGRANANSIISHLYGQGLPLTVANLDAAVVSLQYVLFWSKGNEPVPVTVGRDTRSQTQKAHDAGISSYVREGTHADTSESSWARDIREGREKHVADNKKRERDDQRRRETSQVVLSPNGRQNFAASNALNDEARKRHAEQDARESGKPAVATQPQRIPLHATPQDLKSYDRGQIREWMQRRKIAGLPIN
jgi:hypothetical protein